jgi:hypothetical protein
VNHDCEHFWVAGSNAGAGEPDHRCGQSRDALADQLPFLDFAKAMMDSVVSRVRLPILIASSLPVLSSV